MARHNSEYSAVSLAGRANGTGCKKYENNKPNNASNRLSKSLPQWVKDIQEKLTLLGNLEN